MQVVSHHIFVKLVADIQMAVQPQFHDGFSFESKPEDDPRPFRLFTRNGHLRPTSPIRIRHAKRCREEIPYLR